MSADILPQLHDTDLAEEQKHHCRQPYQLPLNGVLTLTGMVIHEIATFWDRLAMEHDLIRRRSFRDTALCHEPSQHVSEQTLLCADISELNLSKGMSIKFPEGKDKLLIFEITMKPDEGIYRCSRSCGMTSVSHLIVLLHAWHELCGHAVMPGNLQGPKR